MKRALIFLLTTSIYSHFLICCNSEIKHSKNEIISETWKEYQLNLDEELDTSQIEGRVVRFKSYSANGILKTMRESPIEPGIYLRNTYYDSLGNIDSVKTYYEQSLLNGFLEKNFNDSKGNPIKKLIYNIEEGKIIKGASFVIANEYDKNNLISSYIVQDSDSVSSSFKESYFSKSDLLEHTIMKDNSGNVISEVWNTYDNDKLVQQKFILTETGQVKDTHIEYLNLKKIETEKVKDEIIRISEYQSEGDYVVKIIMKEVKFNRKRVIIISRQFKES